MGLAHEGEIHMSTTSVASRAEHHGLEEEQHLIKQRKHIVFEDNLLELVHHQCCRVCKEPM